MTDADFGWEPTSVRAVLVLIDGRWDLPVLFALRAGPLRRSTLRRQIGPVSDKVLTETLRRMELRGLVSRHTVPSVPIEVDYELTGRAMALEPLLTTMSNWDAVDPGPK